MIKSWKSSDLKDLFETGESRRIDTKLHKRIVHRLTVLHHSRSFRDLSQPGFELHKWEGYQTLWSISVSGHWRIIFDWIKGDAYNVDLRQPH